MATDNDLRFAVQRGVEYRVNPVSVHRTNLLHAIDVHPLLLKGRMILGLCASRIKILGNHEEICVGFERPIEE